jgi:hypothetical protein
MLQLCGGGAVAAFFSYTTKEKELNGTGFRL